MLYAIISTDVEDSLQRRKPRREAHLRRLEALKAEGRLVIAGPHPAVDGEQSGTQGFTGSLVIAEFPSLDDARRWADDDPYVEGGVYAHVQVKPFKQVLP